LHLIKNKMIKNGIQKEYIKISVIEDEENPNYKDVKKVYYTIW